MAFISNYYEKEYFEKNDETAKERYRVLNIFIFSLALIIYLYFFKSNYETVSKLNCTDSKSKIVFNELNLMASILIVIAGCILLYIAIFDKDLETEIAFS